MTKLENELYSALKTAGMNKPNEQEVRAAAEVAKKYIEDAFTTGYYAVACISEHIDAEEIQVDEQTLCDRMLKHWLKENGVI